MPRPMNQQQFASSQPSRGLLLVLALVLALPIAPTLLPHPAIAQTTQDRRAEGDRLLQQGIEKYDKGYSTDAEDIFRLAVIIYQGIQDRNGEATALMHLGMAYGTEIEAIGHYTKALTIFRQLKNRQGEVKVLVELGDFYYAVEKYKEAVPYFEQALTLSRQLKDRTQELEMLARLATMHMFLSQAEKANFYFEEFEKLERTLK